MKRDQIKPGQQCMESQYKQKTNFKPIVGGMSTAPPTPLFRYFHSVDVLLYHSLKLPQKLLALHNRQTQTTSFNAEHIDAGTTAFLTGKCGV